MRSLVTPKKARGYVDPTGNLAAARADNPRSRPLPGTARRLACDRCHKAAADCGGAEWIVLAGRRVHVPTRQGRRVLCGPATYRMVHI